MKQIIITLCAFIMFGTATQAQSEAYIKKMQQTLAMLDSAKTVEDLTDASAAFQRIGEAEKTQWLPYYYAALAQTTIGWMTGKGDAVAAVALPLIEKAEAIEKNSELYCLRYMVATQQMQVDAQSRYMTYGAKMGEALANAKKADPNNPRAYYLDGVGVLNTPTQFGGGAAKAKPILEKAVALYGTFKPATPMHPTWGQKEAESNLAKCK
jgi:hypothetical protein